MPEQTSVELAANVRSLGFDLEGLFTRLQYAIDTVGARRVVLDTPEALFAGLSDETILRTELRRLPRQGPREPRARVRAQ